MKKNKTITLKQTINAGFAVQNELYEIGLWNEGCLLTNVEIYFCLLPQLKMWDANGYFLHGTSRFNKLLGYEHGHIYIPKFVLSQLLWQERGSLREVIRHEYGHAFAHYYSDLIIYSTEFEKVFGGNYYDGEPSEMEKGAYVSDYASILPMEDFAETFALYVRRKGVLPDAINNRKLKRKWNFICKIIKKI
jgi:Putative zinc-binding metallo-peptidase